MCKASLETNSLVTELKTKLRGFSPQANCTEEFKITLQCLSYVGIVII
jgi:hypothetical protein